MCCEECVVWMPVHAHDDASSPYAATERDILFGCVGCEGLVE